jgi:putative nucleotidyltransferase with HDIG domain
MAVMEHKILIVEDSPTQAEELKYMLECNNYEVEVAVNGLDALKVLKDMKPLVIISDIVMPVMGGYELCRRIKDTENIRGIPVILLTGLSEPEDVIAGLACGADYFLTKPYDDTILLSRIQHIIANLNPQAKAGAEDGIEIVFRNQKYCINSDRLQILNLLLSTYETAIQKKRELIIVQGDLLKEIDERKRAEEEVKKLNEQLEQRVIKRTGELTTANRQLHNEITERKLAEDELSKQRELLEEKVAERTGQLSETNAELSKEIGVRRQAETELQEANQKLSIWSLEKMQRILMQAVASLSNTMERRDPYTAGHQRRVAQLATAIATAMGLSTAQIDGIAVAGNLHDIGKINVPSEVLNKPGKLSDLEFAIVKTHSQAGCEIVRDIEFPWPVAEVLLQHHERMNGSGYPRGLAGEAILVEARIMAVADVVEAMASHRPYRSALGIDAALEEISKNRSTLYDPDAVDACLDLFRKKGFELE